MKKRLMSFLLAIFLFLPALKANAESINAIFYVPDDQQTTAEPQKQATSLCGAGDTLYLLTQTTLERWKPGMEQPEVILKDVYNTSQYGQEDSTETTREGKSFSAKITTLLANGLAVYGLNQWTGELTRLVDENGAVSIAPFAKMDFSVLRSNNAETMGFVDIRTPVLTGDALYFLSTDYQSEKAQNTFYAFDVKSGKASSFSAPMVKSLSAYRDGLLLCKYYDDENAWNEETGEFAPMKLAALNPITGETRELLTLEKSDAYGVRYRADTDTIYYGVGSMLRSIAGLSSPSKASAYLPSSMWEDQNACLLEGGNYAIADYSGVVIRALDMPEMAKGALTIYGEYGSEAHRAFVSEHPEISVMASNSFYQNLEAFTSAMVSGENAVDVLRLSSSFTPLRRLMEKGYCMDLSGFPELAAAVDSMYPQLAEFLKVDGKLYGVPIGMNGSIVSYRTDAWKTLGLTEEDVPKTWMDLLDFVQNWMADYGEDHPEYMLLEGGTSKQMLMEQLMTAYVNTYAAKGQDLTFDTPVFRQLMEKLEQIDFSAFENDMKETDGEEFWNRTPIFMISGDFSYVSGLALQNESNRMTPLRLSDEEELILPVNLDVLIVNPRTTRTEQAVSYLSAYLAHADARSTNITLYPDHNESVKNPNYEQNIQELEKEYQRIQDQLKSAPPEEIAGLKDNLAYYENALAHKEDNLYWVSAQDIALYRESLAPYLKVLGQTVLATWDKEGKNDFYTLQAQYLQGAMNMDQFIREIDKRVRMMVLEEK